MQGGCGEGAGLVDECEDAVCMCLLPHQRAGADSNARDEGAWYVWVRVLLWRRGCRVSVGQGAVGVCLLPLRRAVADSSAGGEGAEYVDAVCVCVGECSTGGEEAGWVWGMGVRWREWGCSVCVAQL